MTFFLKGNKCTFPFLLIKGEVGIFLPTNETNNPNFPVGENEIFGEMGVIEDTLRSAGARCLTDCVVISLSKKEYEKKLFSSYDLVGNSKNILNIFLVFLILLIFVKFQTFFFSNSSIHTTSSLGNKPELDF